jgi:alpha-D-xyloside xylohydrolase
MNRFQSAAPTRYALSASVLCLLPAFSAASAQQLNLSRGEATVLVEPYAPNIVRVSISLRRDDALAPPG